MKSTLRFALPLVAIFALACSALADTTPIRYFLSLDGVSNGTPFAISSFQWGMGLGLGFTPPDNWNTGSPSLSELTISKSFDGNDNGIVDGTFNRHQFANARIRGYRGLSTTPFIDIYLDEVYCSGWSVSASTNSMPGVSASLDFRAITLNGVVMDRALLLNPAKMNQLIASIIQKASGPASKHKAKVEVR